MKLVYVDTPQNPDIYMADSPGVKVRATFIDGGDVFVYASYDALNTTYINRAIDPHNKPHIYFVANMEEIEDEEQFQRYSRYIQDNTNFAAQHEGERVDGEATGLWTPTFTVT